MRAVSTLAALRALGILARAKARYLCCKTLHLLRGDSDAQCVCVLWEGKGGGGLLLHRVLV